MKKSTIGRATDVHRMYDEEFASVMDIADQCMATVSMNAVGGNRLRQWSIGRAFWEKQILSEYVGSRIRLPTVLTVGHEVAGYLMYTIGMKVVVVNQIAVAPRFWRRGYATQLLDNLKKSLSKMPQSSIGATVAERNLGAQLLFRKNGFQWFRTESNKVSRQDAYLMHWRQMIQ